MGSSTWFIPLGYMIYIGSLVIANSIYASNNQPIMALGIRTRWWAIGGIFLIAIILDMALKFYDKWIEENM